MSSLRVARPPPHPRPSRKTTIATPRSWSFSEAQIALVPELRYVVDGQVPIEEAQAYFDAQRGWPTVAIILVAALLAPALALLLRLGLGFGTASTVAIVVGLCMVVSWLLLGLCLPALRRRRIRTALRERLRAAGIHPCPACAYDMRASPAQCPECGERGERGD